MNINGLQSQPAVGIFFARDGKVLLGLRNYIKDGKLVPTWTIPGGQTEPGETVEDGLRREVLEEIGVTDYSIDQFLGIISGIDKDRMVHVYLGSTLQEPELREPEKFSEWHWFRVEEIPSNFINPLALELLQAHFASQVGHE